jgi:predicted DNA-binding transcriptional regulator YafY
VQTIFQRNLEEGAPLEIIYLTEKGAISQRRIQIFEIRGNLIRAYCYLRNTKRTFKAENILSARLIHPRYKQPG